MNIKAFFSVLLVCLSFSTHAFKIDTHVWIGQQIINDLADGKLTIQLNGKNVQLPVNAETRQAILNRKSEFLLATLGPDAFPDFIAGQIIIHPGEDFGGAWKSNGWLRHVFDQMEIAERDYLAWENNPGQYPDFVDYREISKVVAFGFLVHAASDVFAHTYVNLYSGDVFELADSETVVEQRHFLLESFISKYLPPLKDNNGVALGNAWDIVNASPAFFNYVRDVLIYHPDAQEQYLYETAPHLIGMANYRKGVNDIASSGIWHEIDRLVIKAFAAYYGYDISSSEAESARQALQKVLDAGSATTQQINDIDNKMSQLALKLDKTVYSNLHSLINKYSSDRQKLLDLESSINKEIRAFEDRALDLACDIVFDEKFYDPLGLLDFLKRYDPASKLLSKLIGSDVNPLDPLGLFSSGSSSNPSWAKEYTGTREEFVAKRNQLQVKRDSYTGYLTEGEIAARDYYTRYINELNEIISSLQPTQKATITYGSSGGGVSTTNLSVLCERITDDLIEKAIKLDQAKASIKSKLLETETEMLNTVPDMHRELNDALASFIKIKQALYELSLIIGSDTSPIAALLDNWVKEIDVAVSKYSEASSQSVVNSINPNADAKDPLLDWVSCYQTQLLTGAPSQIVGCETMTEVENIITALKNVELIMIKAATLNGALGTVDIDKVGQFADHTIDDLQTRLAEELTEEFIDQLPSEYSDFLELLDKPITDSLINQTFQKPATNKSILYIDNMADKVRMDMGVKNGVLNTAEFATLNNALILSKLALLDSAGINTLLLAGGLPANATQQNLVADAFANLDGHFQWMNNAPPLPRQDKNYTSAKWLTYSSNTPFMLWQSDKRDGLFRQLFSGPLAPSLVKDNVFNGEYPYQICFANPFPDGSEDKVCIAAWLIPVLFNTLH